MAQEFRIEIATPVKLVLKEMAESAQIPAKDGFIGVLPDHAALLSELGEGELSITHKGNIQKFQVSGGYVEIRDNHVRVLADVAK